MRVSSQLDFLTRREYVHFLTRTLYFICTCCIYWHYITKILEMYILDTYSVHHQPHPAQFGFTSHRGTDTAIAVAHDVSQYYNSRGSSTFTCSLDAEGAFDHIPPVFEPGIEKGETHVSPSWKRWDTCLASWDTCLTKLKKVRHSPSWKGDWDTSNTNAKIKGGIK